MLMKKILFLLLLIPSLSFGQFLRLPYSYLLHTYQGDTIKQYFSGDSAKWYTDKGYVSFGKPIYSAGKKLITTADTTNKWLPKTSPAANSNLFQGKDTIYYNLSLTRKIKASDTTRWGNGESTTYANSGLWKDIDTIKLKNDIFIHPDSTFQIYVNGLQTFQTGAVNQQTFISSPSTVQTVTLSDETSNTTITCGNEIRMFSGGDTIVNFINSITGEIKSTIDNAGNISNSGTITPGGRLMIPMGEISYFSTTGTTVTISGTSDGSSNMVVVNPTTTLNNDMEFDNGGSNNGRLRYTGATTRTFHVACTISYSAAVANQNGVFGVAKNGTVVAASKILPFLGLATDTRSTALHLMVSLATNDYLELYVGNTTASNNITIKTLNLFAMGM